MLIAPDSNLYVYVISRDFGFAPNPFYGLCTLATCKPIIRKGAVAGDWILGIAGKKLGATVHRKCIMLMRVSNKIGFQEYWDSPDYSHKKPCRTGSQLKMLGDNIYHRHSIDNWIQEDSHHSNPDGTANEVNLKRDTGHCDQVLISNYFLYFGDKAFPVDLESIGYKSTQGHTKIKLSNSAEGRAIIETTCSSNKHRFNQVISDPCQFMNSHQRVDQGSGQIFD